MILNILIIPVVTKNGKTWRYLFLALNSIIGSEQSGIRPCLVISSDVVNHLNQITVLPITSMKSTYRTIYPNEVYLSKEVSLLSKDSIVLAHQIHAVDKKRLIKYINNIAALPCFTDIENAIKFHLELK